MTRRWKTSARFLDPLATIWVEGDWELLLKPLRYDMGGGLIYTVERYLLSDGTSRPWWAERIVSKGGTKRMGFLHDDARSRLHTTNFLTDGLLFDAALAETGHIHTAIAAWLGVRIGTHTGYNKAVPESVVNKALMHVAQREGLFTRQLHWDAAQCRIHLPNHNKNQK